MQAHSHARALAYRVAIAYEKQRRVLGRVSTVLCAYHPSTTTNLDSSRRPSVGVRCTFFVPNLPHTHTHTMDRRTYTHNHAPAHHTRASTSGWMWRSPLRRVRWCVRTCLVPPLSREAHLRHAHLLRKRVDTGGLSKIARRRVAQAAYDIVDAFAR